LLTNLIENPECNLSDEEIFGSAFIFLMAGHDTTTHTLSFLLRLLAVNQDKQQKLFNEVRDLLGEKEPTYADFDELVYSQCVFKETLRLYPVIHRVPKSTIVDTQLGDVVIPANSSVTLCIYGIQRDPMYWKDPEKFEPERFDPRIWGRDEIARREKAFFPFSLGRRRCIGERFAMVQLVMAVSHIVNNYTISLPPGTDHNKVLELKQNYILGPAHNLKLHLKKRQM